MSPPCRSSTGTCRGSCRTTRRSRRANPNSGTVQWTLAKEGFYAAWNITRGDGALVGVIDTGIDGAHPDLRSKIAAAIDQQDPSDVRGTAMTDEVGHGTHVASLACAATGNGIGMAGAGYDCRLLIEKSDFTDSSIAASIVDAADRHVGALNMSFGPAAGTRADAGAPDPRCARSTTRRPGRSCSWPRPPTA